ncbi:MAG: acyl-CoA dehydratase activase [Archaeoglobaceae archaeon]|nr:acyl-CoA dehydratase activase [Archaeoglobaceae archaeon]
MMFLGIDVGTRFTKAVLWNKKPINCIIKETVGEMKPVFDSILKETKKSGNFVRCCATGGGAKLIDFADIVEDETVCLGIAGRDVVNADYIIDIGAQSITVLSVDKDGNVLDYVKNDKCASGSGKFIEVISSALGISLSELDNFVSHSNKKLSITSQCAVFAESEIVSYMNMGERREDILSAICDSIAKIVVSQANKLKIDGRYTITGGVAKFESVVERLRKSIKGEYVRFPQPQFAAAIGAGIISEEFQDV